MESFKERIMIHLHQTVFRFYPHYLEYEEFGKCEIYANNFQYETNKFDVFNVNEQLFNILNTFAYFDFLTINHVEPFIISVNAGDIKINKILVKAIVTFCKTTNVFGDSVLVKSFFVEFVAYFRSIPPNYELFIGIPYYELFLHNFLTKHMLMWICKTEQENYVDSLDLRVIANDYLMWNVCNFLTGKEMRN
jgi:hypothetical protein